MKIRELIKILQEGNSECKVFMDVVNDNGETVATENIGVSFDDNGDVSLYESGVN